MALLSALGFDSKPDFCAAVASGPLTKDAHEVQQIEPAAAGLRGQPSGGWTCDRLRHAHHGLRLRGQFQGRGTQQLRRDRRLRDQLGLRLHAPDSRPRPFLRADATRWPKPSPPTTRISTWSIRTTTPSSSSSSATTASSIRRTPSIRPESYPLAVAVNGSNLFVVDTYQPLPTCSTAEPCSGSVGVFPILPASGKRLQRHASGALGTPVTNTSIGADYWPLTLPAQSQRRDCADGDQRPGFGRLRLRHRL